MPNPPTVAGAVADLVFTSLRSLLTFSPHKARKTIAETATINKNLYQASTWLIDS